MGVCRTFSLQKSGYVLMSTMECDFVSRYFIGIPCTEGGLDNLKRRCNDKTTEECVQATGGAVIRYPY